MRTKERAFRHLGTRKVHKDGTFSFAGITFEAPRELAGQSVELRYVPDDPTDVILVRR